MQIKDIVISLCLFAVVSSVLIAASAIVRASDQTHGCTGNLRELCRALSLYTSDCGTLPWQGDASEALCPQTERKKISADFKGNTAVTWIGQLSPYIQKPDTMVCAKANLGELPKLGGKPVTYGFNFMFSYPKRNPPFRKRWPFLPRLELKGSEEAHMAFADSNWPFIDYMWEHLKGIGFANGSFYRLHSHSGLREKPSREHVRHRQGSNIVFMDGHVETMTFEELIMSRLNYYLFTEDGDFM